MTRGRSQSWRCANSIPCTLEKLPLLTIAGGAQMAFRWDKTFQTVLRHLPQHLITWLVLGIYAMFAGLTSHGYIQPLDPDIDVGLSEAGILVTFMIVFYVGYCYNRFEQSALSALALTMASH